MDDTEEINKFFMNSTMSPVELLGQKPEPAQPSKEKAA
jgi:hypothetical protein